jgi:hypothetical protein
MEIALSRSEFEHRYGLKFISGEDSLGRVDSAYFNDEFLGPVTILCYEKSPDGMAMVFIDSALTLRVAVPRLVEVFGLDHALLNLPRDLD